MINETTSVITQNSKDIADMVFKNTIVSNFINTITTSIKQLLPDVMIYSIMMIAVSLLIAYLIIGMKTGKATVIIIAALFIYLSLKYIGF